MPPPRLRLLYAGQMLDGRVLQVFPKRCPPPRPGTGAVFVRPRPRAGAAALRLLRKAFPQDGKRAYCSAACVTAAKHRRQREYMRRKRAGE